MPEPRRTSSLKTDRLGAAQWRRYRAVRLRALSEAPDAFARRLEEEAASDPAEWQALFHDDAATFVAVIDAADVGLVTGAKMRGREGVAGLFGLWVAPEARRRGVGDALVRAVVDWARGAGYARLLIEVADSNGPAVALYARAGFEPTGATGTMPPPREHITEHERALDL